MTTTQDTPTSSVADLQLALYAEQTRDEYNGWTNRETWATALHLSNDYDLYQIARRLVAQADTDVHEWYDDNDMGPVPPIAQTHAAPGALEQWVADMVSDYMDDTAQYNRSPLVGSMISDVGSFWRVDWHAVADSFREEDDNT